MLRGRAGTGIVDVHGQGVQDVLLARDGSHGRDAGRTE